MNAFRPRSVRLRRRPERRPIAAPTALSLTVGAGLLALALVVPDRGRQQMASAAGVTRISLTPGTSQRPVSLRDRLIAGLRARRGTEVEFIDRVVHFVRIGKLPERLVNQTFFWSRDRAARTNYRTAGTLRPIIYFQLVMTAQAKRLGVEL